MKKDIKVGDRVGVGAQAASCHRADCEECSNGLENYCQRQVTTYASPFPQGGMAYGGYANYHRADSRFTFKIPDGLPSEEAAPMLCGGITIYSPLVNNGCGPGKTVGIIGVGGIGHFGILFSKALGASKVVAISRKGNKREDAFKLGADEYIATDEDADWTSRHGRSLDLIISTVSSPHMPLEGYLSVLKPKGTLIQIGLPDDKLPSTSAFAFIMKGVRLGGSLIGPPWQIEEMLKFAAEKKVKPWIQTYPMSEANKAVVDFEQGKPRYRITLVNERNVQRQQQ